MFDAIMRALLAASDAVPIPFFTKPTMTFMFLPLFFIKALRASMDLPAIWASTELGIAETATAAITNASIALLIAPNIHASNPCFGPKKVWSP